MCFLKGCLITFGVFLLLALAAGTYAFINRDELTVQINDWAKTQSVARATELAKYEDITTPIDEAAANSTTFFQFAATVEQLDLPPELLSVEADVDGDDTEILRRIEWNGRSSFTSNGFG
ncbi:MAG: hypothetical protein WA771_10130, partial [Chthoniobacterales bacterium]